MNIVETKNLKKYYGSGETVVRALDGVNMCVEKGKMTAVVGASGSGKSTMLNLIGALDKPSEGDIEIEGKSLAGMNRKQLAIFRRRYIGFVFQSYNLLPVLNGYDNITLPATFDKKNSLEVMLLFQEMCKKYNQSILFVTHNEELAQLCDRTIVFEDGKIKEVL